MGFNVLEGHWLVGAGSSNVRHKVKGKSLLWFLGARKALAGEAGSSNVRHKVW